MARDGEKGKPLVLLGHSMGSFAAQLYLLDHSELLDGVALSGTTASIYWAPPQCRVAGSSRILMHLSNPREPRSTG
jgi:alpha-beta hydrolase superfamily lysophospholipase